jgi:hypothetical protein
MVVDEPQFTHSILSGAPAQYERQYFAELTRAFTVYTQQMNTPGPWRATNQVFTNLPSGNDVGLEPGSVFEVDGFLKVSRVNNPHVAGVTGTGAAGSVTVVTT